MLSKALIIGAGPAGASAALGFLRCGWEAALFEQQSDWRGRVCGSFISPEGVRQLHWLGVWKDLERKNPISVPAVLLTSPHGKTEIDISQNGVAGLAVSRKDLEETLLEAAQKQGAHLHLGARVVDVNKKQQEWTVTARQGEASKEESGTLIVYADGRFSMGRDENRMKSGWYGLNASFKGAHQKPGQLALHFFKGGYLGLITFSNHETNVCGLIYRSSQEPISWDAVFSEALERQPFLKKMLQNAERTTHWKGVGPLPYSSSLPTREQALFVGDAASVGDPFMGEGISRSLSSGYLISKAFTKTSAIENSSKASLAQAYKNAWRTSYASRFRWGKWLRTSLASDFRIRFLFSPLLRQRRLVHFLIPSFHGGVPAEL